MLDFRYHALSLVAVFLALAIGIVLGVTIGDSLLSEAEQGVRNSLRSDVVDAREDADDARDGIRVRDEFIERVAPGLVRDRLVGRRVAVVAWGALPEDVEDGVRAAVRAAGGRVDSISQFADPVPDLEEVVGEGQFRDLADGEGLDSLGRRVGRTLIEGGDLTGELRDLEGDRFRGRYLAADVAVWYHAPVPEDAEEPEPEEAEWRRALEEGVLDGLQDTAGVVVGVEASDTDPSQVPLYGRRDLTSVDSVDLPGGQVALVFALAGEEGTFGFKPGAREPIPDSDELGF